MKSRIALQRHSPSSVSPVLSGRYAIDIVLLPDRDSSALAIEMSAALTNTENTKRLLLNRVDHLPHITLAMGVILEEDLDQLADELVTVAAEARAVQLTTDRIKTPFAPTDAISLIDINRSSELDALHEPTITLLMSRRLPHVVASDFSGSLPMTSGTVDWVQNFEENAAHDHFSPHITLGYGHLPHPTFPDTFLADRLAVCHLGKHCTCSKLLFEVPLK